MTASPAHPWVQAYKANKAQYDTDYFLSSVSRTADRDPHLEALRAMPEFQALMAKISDHEPFDALMLFLDEMGPEDLSWLADNMPSGWQRSHVLERLERKASR